jgi:hypothetical protein
MRMEHILISMITTPEEMSVALRKVSVQRNEQASEFTKAAPFH